VQRAQRQGQQRAQRLTCDRHRPPLRFCKQPRQRLARGPQPVLPGGAGEEGQVGAVARQEGTDRGEACLLQLLAQVAHLEGRGGEAVQQQDLAWSCIEAEGLGTGE
jgi:hypothetical protein